MIKEKLTNAIRSLSSSRNIKTSDLRIKISKPSNSLKYEIMKNTEVLEETNLATALNINTVTAFMVSNRLQIIIDSLVRDYKVPSSTINIRIYTKTEDCNPLIYLYDGFIPKQQLDIDKLI